MKILLRILPIVWVLACVVSVNGNIWVQTDWGGGRGQDLWSDTTMYYQGWSEDGQVEVGELKLKYPGWEPTGDLQGATLLKRVLLSHDGSIYTAAYDGRIFRSTNNGVTWAIVGSLPVGVKPLDMIEASDGSFFVVYDKAYRSFDGCATWFETSGFPMKVKCLYSIAEASGTIYVGGHVDDRLWHEGQVFKSTDGVKWDTTAWPPQGSMSIRAILHGIDGALYAAGSEGGCVLRSTNKGVSWSLGHLEGPMFVCDLVQSSDSSLYAGTDGVPGGHVWRSTDLGTTWLDNMCFPELAGTECLLAASDGSIYATGGAAWDSVARIHRSTDGGSTWVETGQPWLDSSPGRICDFLQIPSGTIFASGKDSEAGQVYKLSTPNGWIVSSVLDAGIEAEYGAIRWTFSTEGDSPIVKVRTDSLPDMSGAFDWDICPPATNGQDISLLSSVHDGQRYIQYRIEMEAWDNFSTPSFHEIGVEYTSIGVSERRPAQLSNGFSLRLYPNPFRKQVAISFAMPESCHLQVSVLDIIGRPVMTVMDGIASAGEHSITWDGCDAKGVPVCPGIHFCRLSANNTVETRKIVLLR
jgi:photosystem II stability/assembly factor-like uncharacterized protein